MDAKIKLLKKIGFGEYEARAYLALLRNQPMNGYELAKASGLPRANVYSVLQKLEERGAVVRLEISATTRYAAVPPKELTQKLGNRFQATLEAAQHSLEKIAGPVEHEFVWNTRGYEVVLEEARVVIDAAHEQLLIALCHPEALRLAEPLCRAEARGVNISTLCLEACPQPCEGCRGRLYRYRIAMANSTRWLVLIANSSEVLAAEIDAADEALAVRTRQKLLVDLSARYIRHSIALAALVGDLGKNLENYLAPETQTVLASIDATAPNPGWLLRMRNVADRQPAEL